MSGIDVGSEKVSVRVSATESVARKVWLSVGSLARATVTYGPRGNSPKEPDAWTAVHGAVRQHGADEAGTEFAGSSSLTTVFGLHEMAKSAPELIEL